MELDHSERKIVLHAIDEWKREGKIDEDLATQLKQTIVAKQSRQQLANYFFMIALAGALLSFGALFIDEKFLEQFRQYFSLSNWTIAAMTAALAAFWYVYIFRRRADMQRIFFEMQLTGASVIILTSLVYTCKELGEGTGYTGLLSAATLSLLVLYFIFRSTALWIGVLLGLMGWFGAFSYVHSTRHLFLGLNYPVRFAIFGFLLSGFSLLQGRITSMKSETRTTLMLALFLFFTAMWGVSVFGNYNNLEQWAAVKQTHVLIYAIISGITSVGALYYGIKNEDAAIRDMGVIFLLLNFYTRYFEYFWDTMNKGFFFLIIAVSFWAVGRWLIRRKTATHR